MHRDENHYEICLFEADYGGQTDCSKMHEEKGRELSARVKAFLKSAKLAPEKEQELLKTASSCNTFAAITRSRLLFWRYEERKDEVAFVVYNKALTMEAPEVFYLLSAVSAGAVISQGVSSRFPQTLYTIMSFSLA